MRCLWFGIFSMQQAYIEYESQSQGISSQTCDLLKLKRIAITRQLRGKRGKTVSPVSCEKREATVIYLLLR